MRRRVVMTGASIVSGLGVGLEKNWSGLLAGRSGISRITRFDPSLFKCQIAAQVADFHPEEVIPAKELKLMDLFIQYSMVAAHEAFIQSGLVTKREHIPEAMQDRAGAVIGCGLGGLPEIENTMRTYIERGGPSRVSPFFIPKVISNLAPGHAGIVYGLRGPNFSTTSACSSGAHAIGESYRMIQMGLTDLMLSGGTEGTISLLAIGGFDNMRALSTRNESPQTASRPFDKDRDGFVCGEGAGIVILEEYEHAKKRGANIIAEVIGYGANCDAYHFTAPTEEGQGAAGAMELALKDAKINPEQVGAVNAHGTSTPLGDVAETKAMKRVFKDHAKKLKISSTKSMIGHTLGAAGGIEAVISALTVKSQTIPPTMNLQTPDSECDLDYVPNAAQNFKHDIIISNSFGFGGTNATLVLKRV